MSIHFLTKTHKSFTALLSFLVGLTIEIEKSSFYCKDTLTTKMLQEETSSRFFLFTESRYKTSENPWPFALVRAFKTCMKKGDNPCIEISD